MQELRIGLVGPGQIADTRLLPGLAAVPGAVLWSILGSNSEQGFDRAAACAARHRARGPVPATTDPARFFADPQLDAVIIAAPDRLHAPLALAAAAAGKHLFIEKPLATSAAEAAAIVAACRAADLRLGVAYHLRFHAGLRALRAALAEGRIGRLLHLRGTWTFRERDPDNWRGGAALGRWWALAATGTHLIDLSRWLVAAADPAPPAVASLRALAARPVHHRAHEETCALALRFESGVTCDLLTSVLFRAPRDIELYGDAGTARASEVLGPHGGGVITINDVPLPYTPEDPYAAELRDFVAAVRDGRDPEVSGEEGLANVRLLEQAEEASR